MTLHEALKQLKSLGDAHGPRPPWLALPSRDSARREVTKLRRLEEAIRLLAEGKALGLK